MRLLSLLLCLTTVFAALPACADQTPETGQPDPFHYYRQAEYQLRSAYWLLEPDHNSAEAGDHRDNKYPDIQNYKSKVEITDNNLPPDTTSEVIAREQIMIAYNDLRKNVVDDSTAIQLPPAVPRPANYIRRLQRVTEMLDDARRYIGRGVNDYHYMGARERSYVRIDEAERVVKRALANAVSAADVGGSVAQQARDQKENAENHDQIQDHGAGFGPQSPANQTQAPDDAIVIP